MAHHCIQGTAGAAFHPQLNQQRFELVLRKGFRREIDSYSAFLENDRATRTGLAGYLQERGIRRVVLAGLALDYCVRFSAEDARRIGFETVVVHDACRPIGDMGAVNNALEAMRRAGVELVRLNEIQGAV